MTAGVPPPGDILPRLRNRPLRWAAAAARPALGLLALAAGVTGFLEGRAVWQARTAVGPGWAAAVAGGLALPAALMAAAWLARRRRMVSRVLWWAVAIAAGNGYSVLAVPLTRAWLAGMAAIPLPVDVVALVLLGWHAASYRLFVAVVGRDGDGWGAAVSGDGRAAAVAAATLSAAAAAAQARVSELRSRRRSVAGLHIVIAPWPGAVTGFETWYRISGTPGRLAAACRGRPTARGATAEELVAAIERTPGINLSRTALLWPGGPRPPR
ncbi:MAG TPA: hypothetical protein VKV35_04135 [Streptosporangiaceae bacterium]|nr:hypothetical protein [Streptosporangiaceae bacterium]